METQTEQRCTCECKCKDRKQMADKRKRTQEKLRTKWVKNSSLPMWLADLAVDFNPEDPLWFQTYVLPELKRRQILNQFPEGDQGLTRFQPQLDSLKRFILNNWPAQIVSKEFTDKVEELIRSQELTWSIADGTDLQRVKLYLERPKELLRLLHSFKKRPTKRVPQALLQCNVFKPSFTNIAVSK